MRRSTVKRAIREKFIVTLKDNEGTFSGILVECAGGSMTFAQCDTVPTEAKDSPERIAGRVHVFVANVAYLQEVS